MINYKYIPTVHEKVLEGNERVFNHKQLYKEHCLKSIQRPVSKQFYDTVFNCQFDDKILQRRCPFILKRFKETRLSNVNSTSHKFIRRIYDAYRKKLYRKYLLNPNKLKVIICYGGLYSTYNIDQSIVYSCIKFGYRKCDVFNDYNDGKIIKKSYTYRLFKDNYLKINEYKNKREYIVYHKWPNKHPDIDVTNWFNTMGITEEELFTKDQYLAIIKLIHG